MSDFLFKFAAVGATFALVALGFYGAIRSSTAAGPPQEKRRGLILYWSVTAILLGSIYLIPWPFR